jgi:hypothetical protein
MARLSLLLLVFLPTAAFAQGQTIYPTDIAGPSGSGSFGKQVVVLLNGNIVVADPGYDTATAVDAGAVYLYDGNTLALISALTGSHSGDQIGSGYFGVAKGITALSNGNYVVSSPNWNGQAGAVTWASGVTGVTGTVSIANSLVGLCNDLVGSAVLALPDGNYVVGSPFWDYADPQCSQSPGPGRQYGAATWANGATGVTGTISTANSLIGGADNTFVGADLKLLSNGNFLVLSLNGGKGAVTWGSAATGLSTGTLSSLNSLVGSHVDDKVGGTYGTVQGVVTLSNGNYVVVSPSWDNVSAAAVDAGAVTWGNGATGTSGVVSIANSLVGTRMNDNVGNGGNAPGVTPLNNGNYVVTSYIWNNGAVVDAGAVTWGDGATGVKGVITAANSLVGSSAYDYVGFNPSCNGCSGVTALTNGNYVVSSPYWNGSRGAATWGNGATGVKGVISSANSLIGGATTDAVGKRGATALPNGNYVVISPEWQSYAGAVTWGNGATGITGTVSAVNSLVGGSASNYVGSIPNCDCSGVTALADGDYVVSSPYWNLNRGAATWGNGATGITGTVSAANSLVGSASGDYLSLLRAADPFDVDPYPGTVALSGVIPLSNGNFVVASPYWDNGAVVDAGAVTWGNGDTGLTGEISAANSLVGSSSGDGIGSVGVTALANGNYVVASPFWSNMIAGTVEVGAVTWGSGVAGVKGAVSATNSLVGGADVDRVGFAGVTALANGNYVVRSPRWDSGTILDVGAITWGNGASGAVGVVTPANSLVGSADFDTVGAGEVTVLNSGDYIVHSPTWDNGAVADVGAITWGFGATGTTGAIDSNNSVVGATTGQGTTMISLAANNDRRVIAGRDVDQIVTVVELVPRLMVHRAGDGSGVVSSIPAGITCGADCSETFSHGTVVMLAATPDTGSTFIGWSGACNGAGDCMVTMDSARTVTATFAETPATQRLVFLPLLESQ